MTSQPLNHKNPPPTAPPTPATVRASGRRSRSIFAISALAGIVAFLCLNKPNKQAYVEYVSPKFVNAVQLTYCNGPDLPPELSAVGQFSRALCQSAISGGAAAIGSDKLSSFIEGNSRLQQDFVLFNVWTTEIPGKQITTVGIAGQFVPLPLYR